MIFLYEWFDRLIVERETCFMVDIGERQRIACPEEINQNLIIVGFDFEWEATWYSLFILVWLNQSIDIIYNSYNLTTFLYPIAHINFFSSHYASIYRAQTKSSDPANLIEGPKIEAQAHLILFIQV